MVQTIVLNSPSATMAAATCGQSQDSTGLYPSTRASLNTGGLSKFPAKISSQEISNLPGRYLDGTLDDALEFLETGEKQFARNLELAVEYACQTSTLGRKEYASAIVLQVMDSSCRNDAYPMEQAQVIRHTIAHYLRESHPLSRAYSWKKEGKEFIGVVLSEIDYEDTLTLSKKIMKKVSQKSREYGLPAVIQYGIANYKLHGDNPQALIAAAFSDMHTYRDPETATQSDNERRLESFARTKRLERAVRVCEMFGKYRAQGLANSGARLPLHKSFASASEVGLMPCAPS